MTAAALAPDPARAWVVTEPGVVGGMPAEVYHADKCVPGGALSSTGLRRLTEPSTPAQFKEWRENPPAPTDAFVFGHLWHKLVLGEGPEIVTFPKHDARTKVGRPIRDQWDAAVAEGKIVVLDTELATANAMTRELRNNKLAMALLNGGKSEQAMFWRDPETGTWCRSMVDKLRDPRDGRLIIVDCKSAKSAHPAKFTASAWDYGYPQQEAHYVDGCLELGLAERVDFVFIVQEKTAPYLVNVVQFPASDPAREIGRRLNRKAIDTYVRCAESGEWPGYHAGKKATLLTTPSYIERRYEDQAA